MHGARLLGIFSSARGQRTLDLAQARFARRSGCPNP
jgi:hypothetical protein